MTKKKKLKYLNCSYPTEEQFKYFNFFSENLLRVDTYKTFREKQLAEQFGYFNFSLYLVVFRAEQ